MRLFRKSISFEKGLKPDLSLLGDSAFLLECKGLEVGDGYLRPMASIQQMPGNVPSYQHPFPQLVVSNYRLLLLGEDGIYEVNPNWTLTKLASTESASFWTWADFQKFAVLSDGVQNWEYCGGSVVKADSDVIPVCRTFCRFRGRIVGGGVLGKWYDCDEGYVAWSDIGSKSFVLGVKNEAGYMNVEIGEVLRVDADLDNVYCYGTDGVAVLFPARQTFGFKKVSNVGVQFAGNACRNLYVGSDGKLRGIVQGQVKELGFGWLFEPASLAKVVVQYDEGEDAFYLCDGTKAFKLMNGNVTECGQVMAGICRVDGRLMGVTSGHTEEFELWTDWLSFGVSGIKTVVGVELIATGLEDVQIGGRARYADGRSVSLPFVKPKELFTTLKIAGELVSIGVKGKMVDGFAIGGIAINVQFADRRMHRGYEL